MTEKKKKLLTFTFVLVCLFVFFVFFLLMWLMIQLGNRCCLDTGIVA